MFQSMWLVFWVQISDQNLIESHSSQTDCPDLFIPDFTRAKAFFESDRWLGNEEFTLTLTDELGKRLVFAANVLQGIFLLSKYFPFPDNILPFFFWRFF